MRKNDPYVWIGAYTIPATDILETKLKGTNQLTPMEKFVIRFVPKNNPSQEGAFRAWLMIGIRDILSQFLKYVNETNLEREITEVIEIPEDQPDLSNALGPINLNMDNIQFKNLHHSAVDILSTPNLSGSDGINQIARHYLEDLFKAARADLKGGSNKDGDSA